MPESQKKILIVEDDKFLAKMLSRALEAKKYDITLASSGSEGAQKATSQNFDLILVDVMLPDIDGFDVLKRIRQDPHSAAVPVIILSNLGQPEDVSRGAQLGAKEYLIKANLSLDQIVKKVGETLST